MNVSKVEFLNTSTKGKIKVNNAGYASYETTNNDETRSFDLTAHPKVITKDNVIKTIICIKIYFKIIIVNFASFVRISTHKFLLGFFKYNTVSLGLTRTSYSLVLEFLL